MPSEKEGKPFEKLIASPPSSKSAPAEWATTASKPVGCSGKKPNTQSNLLFISMSVTRPGRQSGLLHHRRRPKAKERALDYSSVLSNFAFIVIYV